ncbi:MAG: CRISPR-associated protein Cas4 [Methanomassiliicoccales archaeon]|jgi:CRISPR-associated exonuclease Cas4
MPGSIISASDLERYSYCPLSWWLGRGTEVVSEPLKQGEERHGEFSGDIKAIVSMEERASNWERVVLVFSITATVLGLLGLSFMGLVSSSLSGVLAAISIVWIAAAVIILYLSASLKDKSRSARYGQGVTIAAIVAMVIALNSVTLLHQDQHLAEVFEGLALLWLIAASLALYFSAASNRRALAQRRAQMIQGEIRYVDSGDAPLLRSEKYGLNGRPDYVIEIEGELVPVEIKTGRKPRGPLFSHVLQVAAYGLLVEDTMDRPVSHGILRYGDEEHEIELDQDLRDLVTSKLNEMRNKERTGKVHRNHNRPGKCRSCSRRDLCPERLA